MEHAVVKRIQVGGVWECYSLGEAVSKYQQMISEGGPYRTKLWFLIQLPNGDAKTITIRDEDKETVAYGSFAGLSSFLDYAKEEVENEQILGAKETQAR